MRLRNNAATKRYRRDPVNQMKLAAHTMVAAALKLGLLVAEPCRKCRRKRAEAHHEDYTRPLDVVWLCRRHHKGLHAARV